MTKCHRCNKSFKKILYTHSDWPTCRKCLYEHGEEHQLKGNTWDLLCRYWRGPRLQLLTWIKDILRIPINNERSISRFVNKHRNELVTDGFEICKLLGYVERPDDYYYVLLKKKDDAWREGEVHLQSCVGYVHVLRHRINWFEYGIIYQVWHMNMPSQKTVKEMLKKAKIKLR